MNSTPEQIIAELHKLKAHWLGCALAHRTHASKVRDPEIKAFHDNRASVFCQCAQDLHDLTQTLV